MKRQLGFLVDMDKCLGCFTCAMACKNLYHQDKGIAWRRLHSLSQEIWAHRERFWMSLACNHCENPACLRACPAKAYYKREDGIVVHEESRCIGCRNCVRNCPYGAPQFNHTEGRVEKCSLCHQRIDAGKKPACVQSCPVGALDLVDIADMAATTQFPAGFPYYPQLNPSVRFITARTPMMFGRNEK
jgi:DMSO reductase iron-sulfur subunit